MSQCLGWRGLQYKFLPLPWPKYMCIQLCALWNNMLKAKLKFRIQPWVTQCAHQYLLIMWCTVLVALVVTAFLLPCQFRAELFSWAAPSQLLLVTSISVPCHLSNDNDGSPYLTSSDQWCEQRWDLRLVMDCQRRWAPCVIMLYLQCSAWQWQAKTLSASKHCIDFIRCRQVWKLLVSFVGQTSFRSTTLCL